MVTNANYVIGVLSPTVFGTCVNAYILSKQVYELSSYETNSSSSILSTLITTVIWFISNLHTIFLSMSKKEKKTTIDFIHLSELFYELLCVFLFLIMKVLAAELGKGIHTWNRCAKYLPGLGVKSQALMASPNAYKIRSK